MPQPASTTTRLPLLARLCRLWTWRHDATLAKLYANAATLLSGNAVSALLALGAMWCSTAGLGLWQFGILAAILGFADLVGNTLKFATWEAVVKYGADDLARSDHDAFRRLVAFTTLLDLATALAALIACAGLNHAILPLIGVPHDLLGFALFMSLVACFTVSATSMGVLRLFDRFGLLAVTDPIGPAIHLGLGALCLLLGWGIWAFGAAYLASAAIDRGIIVYMGWRELRRRGLTPTWRDFTGRKTDGHGGLWKFVLANNGRTAIGAMAKQSDDMIVAAFAGPAGAALWRIAKQASAVLRVPARLFVVSVFPQLARLWSSRDYRGFRRLVIRGSATSFIGAMLVLGLFALVGADLLALFFFKAAQAEFVAAFLPSLLLMASRAVTMTMSPFLPALTVMGRAVQSLRSTFIMAVITVPILILLTWKFGVIGAAVSRTLAETLTASVFGWSVFHAVNTHAREHTG